MTEQQYPSKVEQIVRILKSGGWTDSEISVTEDDIGGRRWFYIVAKRNAHTLASRRVTTSLLDGPNGGRLGRSRYDSLGSHYEFSGWAGVRRIASWGF